MTYSKNLIDSFLARSLTAEQKAVLMEDIGSAPTKATGTLTFTGDFAATETVTVGTQVITLDTTASSGVNDIVSATALALADAATSIKELINGEDPSVDGVTFPNRALVWPVTATSAAGVVTLTAITAGSAGNAVATTETAGDGAFGAATLTGGTDSQISANAYTTPAVYADDAASAVAGVPVGGIYRQTSGVVVWRQA